MQWPLRCSRRAVAVVAVVAVGFSGNWKSCAQGECDGFSAPLRDGDAQESLSGH